MSAQQLVYEGTDLEALIQQVLDQHGPAKIRPPERRRKGGFLGFFAREVYTIEVDPADGRAAGTAVDGSAMDGLAIDGLAMDTLTIDGSTARGLAALLDETEDELELSAAASSSTAAPPRAASAPVAVSPPATSSAAAAAAAAGAAKPSAAESPTTRPFEGRSFDEVLTEVASSLGEEPGTYRPGPATMRRITPARLAAPAQPTTEPPATERPATDERPVAPVAWPMGPPDRRTPDRRTAAWAAAQSGLLVMAGFPEWLLPAAAGDVTAGASAGARSLEEAFAAVPAPRPLPRTPGSLVAVVGEGRAATQVARSVAAELGVRPSEIAVAALEGTTRSRRPGYRVRTPDEAADLSAGWRRDGVGVVVVHASSAEADRRWAREMLRAMRPSCVWGLARASTKPEDVERWANDIGGVDALVVDEVAGTVTPAAILSAGIPVVRLDGEPATPERWADVVAALAAGR